ncbi:MAG: LysR family transcriptional regulator [Desulfovibrionaceae bacterium]|nr:LysR family transcriptional regulator [Desulfovibrionaceae bacterium]
MIEQFNGDIIQWLRAFYYIAETGSVRKAAEYMHRNPSTVSHELRCLEQELGTVLFDRYKKTLQITPEGTKLLEWTVQTFERLNDMRVSIGSSEGGELKGSMSFATSLPVAILAVRPVADFCREHPKVDLVLQRKLPHEVQNAVRQSRVDFGLMGTALPPDDIDMEFLFKARPLLVAHKVNPWKLPERPSIDDLKKLPYVSFWNEDGLQDLEPFSQMEPFADWIKEKSVIQVNNYHLIMRLIWHKAGVGIMDELCYQATAYGAEWDNMETHPLDHLLPSLNYGILVRRGKHLSPQAKALMEVLREHFRSFTPVQEGKALSDLRQHD